MANAFANESFLNLPAFLDLNSILHMINIRFITYNNSLIAAENFAFHFFVFSVFSFEVSKKYALKDIGLCFSLYAYRTRIKERFLKIFQ